MNTDIWLGLGLLGLGRAQAGHDLVEQQQARARGQCHADLQQALLRRRDFGRLHRYERAGVTHGLTRVRQFSQDDAHCFVMESQIAEEVERLLRLVQRVYGDFGLAFEPKLGTRPPEFLGDVATWDHAEAQLARVDLPRARRHRRVPCRARACDRRPRRRRSTNRPTEAARPGRALG